MQARLQLQTRQSETRPSSTKAELELGKQKYFQDFYVELTFNGMTNWQVLQEVPNFWEIFLLL